MVNIFLRSKQNPILQPSGLWWESKGVLNPGAICHGDRIVLVYRAVGADGISRLGRAVSTDGVTFDRGDKPWAEVERGDWDGRLGLEDPRISVIDETFYLTYTKTGVDPSSQPKLDWEPAPFHIRSWLAETSDFSTFKELCPVLPGRTTKDLVLFPDRIRGNYVALIREYPHIAITASFDLRTWSDPVPLLLPIPGSWEAERIGAGPPPLLTERGWLLLYHANEYLHFPGNKRMYRMGLAILDAADPWHVLYRHPEPIFQPEAPYECEGPVGNVVFGTGLIQIGDELLLYYGAGDGVIGLARTKRSDLMQLIV